MEVITTIKSKADALVFSINKVCEEGKAFDKEKVDEIYDYILNKVNLPDIENNATADYINALEGVIGKYVDVLDKISSDLKE